MKERRWRSTTRRRTRRSSKANGNGPSAGSVSTNAISLRSSVFPTSTITCQQPIRTRTCGSRANQAAKRRQDRSPGREGLLPNARIAAPLLSREGESRRGSGGWGGGGQEKHYPDHHHPLCAG